MAIFDFIKRLFGEQVSPTCPRCGRDNGWNGRRCTQCNYPAPNASHPAATDGRDFGGAEVVAEIVDATVVSAATPNRTSSTLEGFEVDRFAPISTDDALEQTKSSDFKRAAIDPQNVIPTADLPRVRVIDQTMVGLGLISESELVEIHKIGDEWDKYRVDHRLVEAAAQKAVEASRAEKLKLIKQKKEEAAARKKAHEEAVAHRRETDIFYLGRGVSKGLADRNSQVDRLNEFGLPVLATPGEIASAMNVKVPRLRWLAFHSEAVKQMHYINFPIRKKSGGERIVSVPHKEMAAAQRWIFENVLSKLQPHSAAHGFAPGRSILTNAQPHMGADIVINADLKDFFPTISFHRVEGLFKSVGYSPAVATIMALLCTECPRETVKFNGIVYHVATGQRSLPQGACTSPAISNLIAKHFDLRLAGMAEKLGWTYTRYADDITYSAKTPGVDASEANSKTGYVLARLRHIADDEGFVINEKKTRVLRNHTRQSVTGVVVNDRVGVARPTVRKLRAILHNAKKNGLESQNRDGKENFGAWLNGMISYVEMVNNKQGAKLRKSFDEVLNSG